MTAERARARPDPTCRGCSARTIAHWRDHETGERVPLCARCELELTRRPELRAALAGEAATLHHERIERIVERVRVGLVVS